MWLESLGESARKSHVILIIRHNLFSICGGIFIYLNWGHSWRALKSACTFLIYNQMSGSRQEEVRDIFSFETSQAFASSICAFMAVLLLGMFLAWFIDNIGLRASLITREIRHMRSSVRREARYLEDNHKLILTRDHAERANNQLTETFNKAGEILERYNRNSKALLPHVLKRTKLSEKDKTLNDLFDDPPDTKLSPKASGKNKVIKFIRRF